MKINHIGNKIQFNETFSKIKRSPFVNKNVFATPLGVHPEMFTPLKVCKVERLGIPVIRTFD